MGERMVKCTDTTDWTVQLLLGLVVTVALVTVAYFFVDLPVFQIVLISGINRTHFLTWLVRVPDVFVRLAPAILFVGLLRRWYGPWTDAEKIALAAALATAIAAVAVLVLKITFGRACPYLLSTDVSTRVQGGIYGLHPFNFSPHYWALPSGHTACTLSVTCVLNAALPRGRLFWWSIATIVPAALVGLNYHFVGDLLAGAYVGWACAGTVIRAMGLSSETTAEAGVPGWDFRALLPTH